MKMPIIIFSSPENALDEEKMGIWFGSNKEEDIGNPTGLVEYVDKKVVIRAMQILTEQSFFTSLMKDDIEESLNEAIENANKERKEE